MALTSQNQDADIGAIDLAVAQRIRALRKARRVHRSDLAAAVGISVSGLAKYESCTTRIGVGLLFRIAQYLGVPIAEFFPSSPETVMRDAEHRP